MTIGRAWKAVRYLRLRGYLWMRYKRDCISRWGGHSEEKPKAYDKYVRLVMALDKRQEEAMC